MPRRITTPKRKMPKRARMKKGSKEAMEWGKKMREIKKKKKETGKKKSTKKKSPGKKSSVKKSSVKKSPERTSVFKKDTDEPLEETEIIADDSVQGSRYLVRKTMMSPKKNKRNYSKKKNVKMPNNLGTIHPTK